MHCTVLACIVFLFRKENNFQCCPLSEIKPSPVTSAYRNKCEFTVGRHLVTKEKTVGFRLSSYKAGSMSVAEPDDCINISAVMLNAVKVISFNFILLLCKYKVHMSFKKFRKSTMWKEKKKKRDLGWKNILELLENIFLYDHTFNFFVLVIYAKNINFFFTFCERKFKESVSNASISSDHFNWNVSCISAGFQVLSRVRILHQNALLAHCCAETVFFLQIALNLHQNVWLQTIGDQY